MWRKRKIGSTDAEEGYREKGILKEERGREGGGQERQEEEMGN